MSSKLDLAQERKRFEENYKKRCVFWDLEYDEKLKQYECEYETTAWLAWCAAKDAARDDYAESHALKSEVKEQAPDGWQLAIEKIRIL